MLFLWLLSSFSSFWEQSKILKDKMKKFNLKLTAFLVSFFIGLLLLILGSKSKVCFSFGFVLIGSALMFFVLYSHERTQKMLIEVSEKLEQAYDDKELPEEERLYVLAELGLQQKRLNKQQKRINLLFSITGAVLIVAGFVNMF